MTAILGSIAFSVILLIWLAGVKLAESLIAIAYSAIKGMIKND